MNGNRCFLLLLVLFLFPLSALASSDDLLSLYAIAKEKDTGIGKAQSRFDASKADSRISFSQLLPRFEANAGISWLSNTSLNYGPREITGSYTGNNYGISAKIPLFQMSAMHYLSASHAFVRGADAALSVSRQELIVALVEAYFGVLKAQTDEVLYLDEVKRFEQLYDQAKEFKASGTGTVTAELEAKAKLESALADSIKAIMVHKLADQQLENIVGRHVYEVKALGSYIPHGPEPSDVQWWVATMEKNRPALVQARELLTQSELLRKAVYAGHLPTISASGGYAVNKGSTFLPEVETRQWSIGLNLSLPIYSGGETDARTERALAVESEQRHILNEVHDQSVQKLKLSYLNLEYSFAIIPSLKLKTESALMQLNAVKDGRSVGTRTGIDLLNAEQEVAFARRDLAGAIYDNALRQLQLMAAVGTLSESDLVELNALLIDTPSRKPHVNRRSSELAN